MSQLDLIYKVSADPIPYSSPSAGAVHVWWARSASLRGRHLALLDAAERGRLAGIIPPDRRRLAAAGWVLTRLVLARYLGCAAGRVPVSRTCPACGEPHAAPRLPAGTGLALSASHSGDRTVVAVARAMAVGVDVEQPFPADADRCGDLAQGVLAAPERADFARLPAQDRPAALMSYWTQKEAVLKATGVGLRMRPDRLTVAGAGGPPRLIRWPGAPVPAAEIRLLPLSPEGGYVAHLATIGCDAPEIGEYRGDGLFARAAGCLEGDAEDMAEDIEDAADAEDADRGGTGG